MKTNILVPPKTYVERTLHKWERVLFQVHDSWYEYDADDVFVYSNHHEAYIPFSKAFWNGYHKEWFTVTDDDVIVDTPEGNMPQTFAEENGYTYAEDYDGMVHEDDTWYCEISGLVYYHEDYRERTFDEMYAHADALDDSDYRLVHRGYAEGYWVHIDDIAYCEDIDEYVHVDDAHWSENDECYYYDEDEMSPDPDCICDYHRSPRAIKIYPRDGRQTYPPKFWIGFEIEKSYFINSYGDEARYRGDEVGECEFFKGYETDSSCGVEAITNILPLGEGIDRFTAFVRMEDPVARAVINAPANSNCGGHINISSEEHSSAEFYDILRPYLGLFYALFRYRLKNNYCRGNIKADRFNNQRYSPLNLKYECVELRIPNRVTSVDQLKRRYDLTYLVVKCAVDKVPFHEMVEKSKPILMAMYNNDEARVNNAMELAFEFRDYINEDIVSTKIEDYVRDID
jgi:hypothetical protein